MAVNKVVYNTPNGENVLIDLTGDSVTPETLAEGRTAHDASGNVITGTVSITAEKPTQFTNLYDPSIVMCKKVVNGSSSGITYSDDNYCNSIKIPHHHIKGEPVVMRVRGIGTVRDRMGCGVLAADGTTRVNHYQFSNTSYFTLSYDEYGDAMITFKGNIVTSLEWYYFTFSFQYLGINSGVTEAKEGPIITINEPIGNGGYVG